MVCVCLLFVIGRPLIFVAGCVWGRLWFPLPPVVWAKPYINKLPINRHRAAATRNLKARGGLSENPQTHLIDKLDMLLGTMDLGSECLVFVSFSFSNGHTGMWGEGEGGRRKVSWLCPPLIQRTQEQHMSRSWDPRLGDSWSI